ASDTGASEAAGAGPQKMRDIGDFGASDATPFRTAGSSRTWTNFRRETRPYSETCISESDEPYRTVPNGMWHDFMIAAAGTSLMARGDFMASDSQIIMTSVRLQSQLHEQLRRIAFDNKRSLHSLLIEGAKIVAAKNQPSPENRA